MRTDLRLILSSASQTTCATRNHISRPCVLLYELLDINFSTPSCYWPWLLLCVALQLCWVHSFCIDRWVHTSSSPSYIFYYSTCYSFDGEKKFFFICVAYCWGGLSVGTLHAVPLVLYARLMASRCRLYMEPATSNSEKVDEASSRSGATAHKQLSSNCERQCEARHVLQLI